MDKLQEVIQYICCYYAYPQELSNARLTKMVYLADWNSAQRLGRQITTINWYFDHHGPFVDDVINAARRDPNIRLDKTENFYGRPKTLFTYVGKPVRPNLLNQDEINVINNVMAETQQFTFDPFIRYVYNTYPIATADRYEYLNLVQLARQQVL